jgi:pantoate--beta-alanine ligase
MGALHAGHIGLVRMAREENDITVVSIYVNPAQFGPAEDFSSYPRDLEGDTDSLRKAGVDVLFLPDDLHMYSRGFCTHVEVSGLSEKLCGGFRPGHFRGVATVVTKLFNIVSPTKAYFGQKDFQQALIIKRLVKDLDMAVEVVVCPTKREEDGLALSSRNRYLGKEERNAASVIFKSLKKASEAVKSGIINTASIKEIMLAALKSESCVSEIQYGSAYDPETLDEVERIDREALLAVALKVGNTRLIDNILVGPGK